MSRSGSNAALRGRVPPGVFASTLRVRVGYVDTDRSGVMHHSTYLRYFEMARVEYLRERGLDYKQFELDAQLALPVVEANLRYRLPARFDDVLEVTTWVGEISRAKLRFDSLMFRGGELLNDARITLCCVDVAAQRICSMPSVLLALGAVG